jgi:O-antigen/teichoic acid export membrane protein
MGIAKESITVMFGVGISAIFKLGTEAIIARSLSVNDYGLFVLIISSLLFVKSFVSGGVRSSFIRYSSINFSTSNEQDFYKLTGLSVVLIGLLLLVFIAAALVGYELEVVFLNKYIPSIYFYQFCIIAFSFSIIHLIADVFRVRGMQGYFVVINDLLPAFFILFFMSAVVFFGLFKGGNIDIVINVYLCAVVFALVASVYVYIKKIILSNRFISISNFIILPRKDYVWFFFWSFLLTIAWVAKERLAIFLINENLSIEKVAIFFIAIRFMSVFGIVRGGVNSIFMSKIAALVNSGDARKVSRYYSSAVITSFMLVVPPAVFFSYYSVEIIGLIFGAKYVSEELRFLMLVLMQLQVVSILAGPTSIFIQYKGNPQLELMYMLLGVVGIYFSLTFFLFEFGLVGVAIGAYGVSLVFEVVRYAYIFIKNGAISMNFKQFVFVFAFVSIWPLLAFYTNYALWSLVAITFYFVWICTYQLIDIQVRDRLFALLRS